MENITPNPIEYFKQTLEEVLKNTGLKLYLCPVPIGFAGTLVYKYFFVKKDGKVSKAFYVDVKAIKNMYHENENKK